MTLNAIRSAARRYGRSTTSELANADVNDLIQEAVSEFARDVGGFDKVDYPAISATFDTETHFAIRVTIVGGTNEMVATDVAITGTARSATTGAQVASDFQTTLQTATGGDIAVTYDDFEFTVDTSGTVSSTTITFEAPSDENYADARDLLGLTGTNTLSSGAMTGSFPEDCTVRFTLTSDVMTVHRVEWDGRNLTAVPQDYAMSPESSGIPAMYHIRGRTLYLIPSPTSQGLCKIWYRGSPSDIVFSGYQECGLSGKSDESATGLSATTTYYYKLSINGSAVTEYNITTAADVTFSAVIALMNTANSGATWSLVEGDLRCTSDAVDGVSSIAVTAGTTGTDLLATLTGFSAMETAVTGDTTLPTEVPALYHDAISWLVASYMLLGRFDDALVNQRYGRYVKKMRAFRGNRHLLQTRISTGEPRSIDFRVEW